MFRRIRITSKKIKKKIKSRSIPLVFLLCAVLAAKLPGSTGDPVGSCPEFDGAVPIYLSDSVSCEYVEMQTN